MHPYLCGDRHVSERARVVILVRPANVELRTGLGEVETKHWGGDLTLRYKGLEHGTGSVTRYGLVSHAEKAIRRELIGLEPAGIGRGRTKSLLSFLEEVRQQQENTFRAITADLETSEANGVRVLLTADGGTIAILKFECLAKIDRRGAR